MESVEATPTPTPKRPLDLSPGTEDPLPSKRPQAGSLPETASPGSLFASLPSDQETSAPEPDGSSATNTEMGDVQTQEATPPPFRVDVRYRVEDVGELRSPYQVVEHLAGLAEPTLRIKVTSGQTWLIAPENAHAAEVLHDAARTKPRGIVLTEVRAEPPRTKGVLIGYPLGYELGAIERQPGVILARRCVVRRGGRTEETRNVEVHFEGTVLPQEVTLPWQGRYRVRAFVAAPTRCYRCQRFGHVARACRGRSEVCAVCAGPHDSKECFKRRQDASPPAPRCHNCGGNHPAWSTHCKERTRRLRQTTAQRPAPEAAAPSRRTREEPHLSSAQHQEQQDRPRRKKRRRPRRRKKRGGPPPPQDVRTSSERPARPPPREAVDRAPLEETPLVHVVTRHLLQALRDLHKDHLRSGGAPERHPYSDKLLTEAEVRVAAVLEHFSVPSLPKTPTEREMRMLREARERAARRV